MRYLWPIALLCALISAPAFAEKGKSPTWVWSKDQAKINYIDTSQAPKIKVFVSLLDKNLRAIKKDASGISKVTLFRKPPKKGSAVPLFTVLSEDDSVEYPKRKKKDSENSIDEEEPPIVQPMVLEEKGMAMVVIMPGTGPAYLNETLGDVQKSAIQDLLKASATSRLNLLWVGAGTSGSGRVLSYVQAPGASCTLCDFNVQWANCEKSTLKKLEKYGEPAEEGEEKDKDEVKCGLSMAAKTIGGAVEKKPYSGLCPNLFGLGQKYRNHKKCRRRGDLSKKTESEASGKGVKSAMVVALEMLVRDALAGEPRAIVLIGDGRDGYFDRMDEAKDSFKESCATENKKVRGMSWSTLSKTRRGCVQRRMKITTNDQQRAFKQALSTWLPLAQAANIRIYTVANEIARTDEQDRMSILALRTGGTYRYAESSDAFQSKMSDLVEELNDQLVLTFIDKKAVPGAEYSYQVKLNYVDSDGDKSASIKTRPYAIRIPLKPTGLGIMISNGRATLQQKLGKTGFLLLAIGLGLILALILFKLLKKMFGKKAKSVGGLGKKGKKGLKAGMKGAKGAKKQFGKIKKK
jgi:hypothetical protein